MCPWPWWCGWSWVAGPPSRGGSGGIQQPGWPLLAQHAWRLRSLMKVFDAAIRNLAAKGASQVIQLDNKAAARFGKGIHLSKRDIGSIRFVPASQAVPETEYLGRVGGGQVSPPPGHFLNG